MFIGGTTYQLPTRPQLAFAQAVPPGTHRKKRQAELAAEREKAALAALAEERERLALEAIALLNAKVADHDAEKFSVNKLENELRRARPGSRAGAARQTSQPARGGRRRSTTSTTPARPQHDLSRSGGEEEDESAELEERKFSVLYDDGDFTDGPNKTPSRRRRRASTVSTAAEDEDLPDRNEASHRSTEDLFSSETKHWHSQENAYLAEYPRSTGRLTFSTLAAAKRKAVLVKDCGGITQCAAGGENQSLFELRAGKQFKDSQQGERSWKKPAPTSSLTLAAAAGTTTPASAQVEQKNSTPAPEDFDSWIPCPGCSLAGYPCDLGPNSFDSLAAAKKAAKNSIDCGGVTEAKPGVFECRQSEDPEISMTDENSWIAPAPGAELDDEYYGDDTASIIGSEDDNWDDIWSLASEDSGLLSGDDQDEHDGLGRGEHGSGDATDTTQKIIQHEDQQVGHTATDSTTTGKSKNASASIQKAKKEAAEALLKKQEAQKKAEEKKRQEKEERKRNAPEEVYLKIDYSNFRGYFKRRLEDHNDRAVYAKIIDQASSGRSDEDQEQFIWHNGQYWVVHFNAPEEALAANQVARTKDCADSLTPLEFDAADWLDDLHIKIYDREKYDSPNEPEEGKWTDPDFGPNGQTIGTNRFDNVVGWCRACNLFRGEQMELFSTIEPNDISQGRLGDCWLLAAFSAVAEFPGFLSDQVFRQRELPPNSKYEFNFYDPLEEKFSVVTIDDWLPINKDTKKPLFAKPVGNEVWVCLLEKAMAKVYGSYHALQGGSAEYAWARLTGQVRCENFKLKDKADCTKGYRGVYLAFKDKANKRGSFWQMGDNHDKTADQLFKMLKKCDRENFVMSASIYARAQEHQREDGLVEGHEYTVISVHELKDAAKTKLVKLRNPWGRFEWNGRWSDGDTETWEKQDAAALEAAGVVRVEKEDGTFFQQWEDFVRIWGSVGICPKNLGVKTRY